MINVYNIKFADYNGGEEVNREREREIESEINPRERQNRDKVREEKRRI